IEGKEVNQFLCDSSGVLTDLHLSLFEFLNHLNVQDKGGWGYVLDDIQEAGRTSQMNHSVAAWPPCEYTQFATTPPNEKTVDTSIGPMFFVHYPCKLPDLPADGEIFDAVLSVGALDLDGTRMQRFHTEGNGAFYDTDGAQVDFSKREWIETLQSL